MIRIIGMVFDLVAYLVILVVILGVTSLSIYIVYILLCDEQTRVIGYLGCFWIAAWFAGLYLEVRHG
jgi:hypothetical protein